MNNNSLDVYILKGDKTQCFEVIETLETTHDNVFVLRHMITGSVINIDTKTLNANFILHTKGKSSGLLVGTDNIDSTNNKEQRIKLTNNNDKYYKNLIKSIDYNGTDETKETSKPKGLFDKYTKAKACEHLWFDVKIPSENTNSRICSVCFKGYGLFNGEVKVLNNCKSQFDLWFNTILLKEFNEIENRNKRLEASCFNETINSNELVESSINDGILNLSSFRQKQLKKGQ